MKRAAVVAAFLLVAASGIANAGDGYSGNGYSASHTGVGVVPEIITKILTTRDTYPSQGTPDYPSVAGYDVVNSADDGSTIRYNYVRSNAVTDVPVDDYRMIVRGTATERTFAAPVYIGFLWLSLNGVNAGDKITDANVYASVGPFATNAMADGVYYTCRVDTVLSDFGCLDGVSTTADPCLLATSWSNMDQTSGSTPWVPSLASRTNWYEYGPRSSSMHAGDEIGLTQGSSVVFDVTDAVQQIADRGQDAIDLGLLVQIMSIGQTVNGQFSCGVNSNVGSIGGGNPALAVTTSSRRGSKTWNSEKVPVAIMLDDLYANTAGFYDALSGGGVDFDMVSPGSHWNTYSDTDSLYDLEYSDINFIAHSATHTVLASLSGSALDTEIAKETWITSGNISAMPTAPDTTSIDFAWTGGSNPLYSMEAMWKLVAHGYKSSRGTNIRLVDVSPIGEVSPPSWDGYSNLYAQSAYSLGALLLTTGSPELDPDVIRERLLYYIDQSYTDYGRAASLFFGHNAAQDGITPENLEVLETVIDDLHFVERVSYGDLIDGMRSRGLMDLDDVVSETTILQSASFRDSAVHHGKYLTSVKQDSCATAEGGSVELLFDDMWLGPGTD